MRLCLNLVGYLLSEDVPQLGIKDEVHHASELG